MEISFTDNTTKKLVDVINPALSQAKWVKLAVAFAKYSGLALIKESLNACLENGGEVELLVGLDFRMTEPKVLRIVHELTNKGFQIRCYCFSDLSIKDTPIYHPKLYLLINNQRSVITIGSSNLTQGGLKDNVEVNAVIAAETKEEIVSDIYGLYNRLKFQPERFEPDLEYIEEYEKAYERIYKGSVKALKEKRAKNIVKDLEERQKVLPKPKPVVSELFGWQKIVYERLPFGEFRTSGLYAYESEFEKYYPENRNIRPKIRQILQQLRDMGLIKNPHRDKWVRI